MVSTQRRIPAVRRFIPASSADAGHSLPRVRAWTCFQPNLRYGAPFTPFPLFERGPLRRESDLRLEHRLPPFSFELFPNESGPGFHPASLSRRRVPKPTSYALSATRLQKALMGFFFLTQIVRFLGWLSLHSSSFFFSFLRLLTSKNPNALMLPLFRVPLVAGVLYFSGCGSIY